MFTACVISAAALAYTGGGKDFFSIKSKTQRRAILGNGAPIITPDVYGALAAHLGQDPAMNPPTTLSAGAVHEVSSMCLE